jgi:pSer/pThr/pTyr-binding forkhead associated (FHA) protein
MWKLVIEDDEGKRTVVPVTRVEYTIGRREGSSIRLTERNVSRSHAKLLRKEPAPSHEGHEAVPGDGARFVLEDMTSYNGVFVNGLRVTHAQPLEHGDLVQIGDYRIVLQDDTVTDSPSSIAGSSTVPGGGAGRAATLLDRPNRLVMLQGPTPGTEFPLDRERLMIGRAEDADISINHNSVSRLHCEVHALGDSRFELVDKGSSNGVRVNGADLQRGFVEPGDTIELGDVKFRFVGAGQIFRQESQRLAVVPDRVVDKHPPSRSRITSILPLTVFALVALAGVGGAWTYARPKLKAVTPAPESSEEALLREAKKFCTIDDCEAAHERVQSDIPEASPWRNSQDFKDIERQWADVVLARAGREPDAPTKRALYQRVAQAMSVDAERRKLAADRLQDLDSSGRTVAADPMALPPMAVKPRPDDLVARQETSRKAAAPTPDAVLPLASATSSSHPAPGSVDDRVRQLALAGTPDSKVQLRQELEPRVYSGHASEAEVRLLISTCKDLSDKACVQQARAALKQTESASP